MHEDRAGYVWHDGEARVQELAGVIDVSSRGIRDHIPEAFGIFLSQQRLAAFASIDAHFRTWASLRTGAPGFIRVIDSVTVEIELGEVPGDPLVDNLARNSMIGIVAIDPATRRRVRINGRAELLSRTRIRVRAEQVYGNCPQYIQERVLSNPPVQIKISVTPVTTHELSRAHQTQVEHADTFFIASAHPISGADASHRGGNPGFVRVTNARRLTIPDYSGNRMFNTLGNIVINPNVGLIFPDFQSGRTLQIIGRATIDWHPDTAVFPGAQRLLVIDFDKVVGAEQPALRAYEFRSYSPVNPSVVRSTSMGR